MKNKLRLSAIIFLLFPVLNTYADHHNIYLGVKPGQVDINTSVYSEKNRDIVFGYIGADIKEGYSIELLHTQDEGNANVNASSLISEPLPFDVNVNAAYDFSATGVYLAYKTDSDLYLKIKGGVFIREIELSYQEYKYTESGEYFSTGIGAGYNFGLVTLETEYTKLDKDLDFLGVGISVNF